MIIKNICSYGLILTMVSSCLLLVPAPDSDAPPAKRLRNLSPLTTVRVHASRRDDSDARWREVAHGDYCAEELEPGAASLTRTPYNATELTSHANSSHPGPILNGYDNALEVILEGGYIRVVTCGQVRFRRRLRDEPAAARTSKFDEGRSCY